MQAVLAIAELLVRESNRPTRSLVGQGSGSVKKMRSRKYAYITDSRRLPNCSRDPKYDLCKFMSLIQL